MKKIVSKIIALSFLAQPLSLNAQNILLAPVTITLEEFSSALSAQQGAISPIDHHIKNTPQLSHLNELLETFSKAEKTFVSTEDTALIKTKFLDVIALETKDDWDESQRKIFLISYLRLIQTQKDDRDINQWMSRAGNYLNDIEEPSDLIPPPVFTAIQSHLEINPIQSVQIPNDISEIFPLVLVNGKKQSSLSPIKLSTLDEKIRVTFLSPFFEIESQVGSPSQIFNLKRNPTPFVINDCQDSQVISKKFPIKQVTLHLPLHCATQEVTKPLANSKEIQLPMETSIEKKTSWKMEKKHWAWIGLGAVATGLVISQLTHKEKSPERAPTQSYGF